MSSQELCVNTGAESLVSWLERALAIMFPQTIELGVNKRLCLQRACQGRPGRWGVEAFLVRDGEYEARAFPLGEVMSFELVPLTPQRTKAIIECAHPSVEPLLASLLERLAADYPEVRHHLARPKVGTYGGTLDRVREAQALMRRGVPKTKACRRVGIDPRTYDRYAEDVVDWSMDE